MRGLRSWLTPPADCIRYAAPRQRARAREGWWAVGRGTGATGSRRPSVAYGPGLPPVLLRTDGVPGRHVGPGHRHGLARVDLSDNSAGRGHGYRVRRPAHRRLGTVGEGVAADRSVNRTTSSSAPRSGIQASASAAIAVLVVTDVVQLWMVFALAGQRDGPGRRQLPDSRPRSSPNCGDEPATWPTPSNSRRRSHQTGPHRGPGHRRRPDRLGRHRHLLRPLELPVSFSP